MCKICDCYFKKFNLSTNFLPLPSVPNIHKSVHDAMESLKVDFKECYNYTLAFLNDTELRIEKDIWKALLLDQQPTHFKKHHQICGRSFDSHARNYAYFYLDKYLTQFGDETDFAAQRFRDFHFKKYNDETRSVSCCYYDHTL